MLVRLSVTFSCFSGIDDYGDVAFGRELPFFVANFVVFWKALLRCSMEWTRWCAVQGDRCFGLISYNLELLSLVGIIRIDIR